MTVGVYNIYILSNKNTFLFNKLIFAFNGNGLSTTKFILKYHQIYIKSQINIRKKYFI